MLIIAHVVLYLKCLYGLPVMDCELSRSYTSVFLTYLFHLKPLEEDMKLAHNQCLVKVAEAEFSQGD